MAIAMIRAEFGDVEVHGWGEQTGGEAAATIVLLHAAASSPRALGRLAQQLSGDGWRVIAPALAGYGATAGLADRDPIAAHVAVARAVIAQAGDGGPVTLVGHSMGGLVALRTALVEPRVAAVAVYEPVAFGVLDPSTEPDAIAIAWDRRIAETLMSRVDAGESEAGVAAFVEAWNEMAWDKLPEPVRAGLVAAAPRLRREVATVTVDAMRAEAYAAIRAPVLLLRGDRSPLAVRLIAERLHAALPGSRLETIAGAGHMGPVLAPGAIAAAISSFAARTFPAR